MRSWNCWEIIKCGCEPDGEKAAELGICKAATAERYHGINHGVNAGRYCWRVVGTQCGGEVQGSHAQKLATCTECDFFLQVMREEGVDFVP